MSRPDRVVPDDFTTFVARHGGRLSRACAEIAGNDVLAERLRAELLAGVAGRWRRWPTGLRTERALARLERRLRQEARTQHVAVHPAALDLRSSLQLRPAPGADQLDGETAHLAGAAWRRATRVRRRWWAGVGVAALAALAVLLLAPPGPEPEPPLPTEVPERVTVLPAFDELMQGLTGWADLPPYLLLGTSDVDSLPTLTDAPLARARLVAQVGDSRLVVVGDEGTESEPVLPPPRPQRRRLEHPALRGASLVATSLSPDGTVVALPTPDDLVLVDIRTGRVWRVDLGATQPTVGAPVLTWLDATRVMLAGFGTLVVDVATNDVSSVNVEGIDVLSLRGYGSARLAQLVGVPENPDTGEGPHTIRSLLMFWRDMDATGNLEPVAGAGQVGVQRIVTGPPWLSAWVGPGFASQQLVVRACDPATLPLPSEVGPASAAVAAVDGLGNEIATLVSTGGTRLETLGMIRADGVQALVAVRSEGRALLAAWDPGTGTVTAVTYLTADARVSVADLLALCTTCSRVVVELDQETNAATPVNASPTTS